MWVAAVTADITVMWAKTWVVAVTADIRIMWTEMCVAAVTADIRVMWTEMGVAAVTTDIRVTWTEIWVAAITDDIRIMWTGCCCNCWHQSYVNWNVSGCCSQLISGQIALKCKKPAASDCTVSLGEDYKSHSSLSRLPLKLIQYRQFLSSEGEHR